MRYEDTKKMSIDSIKNYYSGNLQAMFESMHPAIVYLSVGKDQLVEGRENLRKVLTIANETDIKYEITSLSCRVERISRSVCYTLVQMGLLTKYPNGSVEKVEQRITTNWRYYKKLEFNPNDIREGWFAIHAHISVGIDLQEPDKNIAHAAHKFFNDTVNLMHRCNRYEVTDVDGYTHYLGTMQIRRVQAEKMYAYVHLHDGSSFKVHKAIADFANDLIPCGFVRIHKSHIVNSMYVEMIKNYKITLVNGEVLPVSQTRFSDIKTELKKNMSV